MVSIWWKIGDIPNSQNYDDVVTYINNLAGFCFGCSLGLFTNI